MKIGKLFGIKDTELSQTRSTPKLAKTGRTGIHPVPAAPHRAVSIVHGSRCCQPAKALEGERLLARSAPSLPLPDCTMPEACVCRFKKHEDRRENEDRRNPVASTTGIWYAGSERRKSGSRKRRSTDR